MPAEQLVRPVHGSSNAASGNAHVGDACLVLRRDVKRASRERGLFDGDPEHLPGRFSLPSDTGLNDIEVPEGLAHDPLGVGKPRRAEGQGNSDAARNVYFLRHPQPHCFSLIVRETAIMMITPRKIIC